MLGFFAFFSVQYGPHTLMLHDFLELFNRYVYKESVSEYYAWLMTSVYVFLGVLVLVTPRKLIGCSEGLAETSLVVRKRALVLVSAFILIMIGLLMPSGVQAIYSHVAFIFGSSDVSYGELRREAFRGTAWSSYAAMIRFSVMPLLAGCVFYLAFKSKNIADRLLYLCLSILIPLLSVVQLNKLFFFYYFFIYLTIYLSVKQRGGLVLRFVTFLKHPFKLAVFLSMGGGVLFSLYYFQYVDAIENGTSNFSELWRTQIYRVFFASADGLYLWIDRFLFSGEPIGLAGSGKLCALFYDECIDVPLQIAIDYLGSDLTTIQTGFLGTGISSYGTLGVFVFCFLGYCVVLLNNAVLYRVRNSDLANVAAPAMFMNAFFMTTTQTTTALLSGGGIITPLLVLLVYFRFKIHGKPSERRC